MKIVDFKCTQIGPYPVLRLVTDVGIDGFAQAEVSASHRRCRCLTSVASAH